jgi:7-carboxy-7-deazaguanine synthase
MSSLRITEIFCSLQGESVKTGLLTTFVRLTGCPLRCQYCDTAYAFKGGETKSISEIISTITKLDCKNICITGGEPLAQKNVNELMQNLCDNDYNVSIETSGAIDIANIDKRVMIIMDLKTPDSKEEHRNLYTNIKSLKPTDQIKFVICSRSDYDWACLIIKKYNLYAHVEVLFSASFKELNATELANWIIQDKLRVRFQMQLHKILWNDEPGH